MSVPEHTPAVEDTTVPEQTETSKATVAAPETETVGTSPRSEEANSTVVGGEPTPIPGQETTEGNLKKDETVVEATPATEGVLAYKAPGIFKQFRYVKNYFWFSEEPVKSEQLAPYIRDEKIEVAHHNAAWAQETGKGVLFHAKRTEDKATPAGLIMLADVTDVVKEGTVAFQFKTGHHTHKFEAANSEERASWIVAIETQAKEAKEMKESVTGSEGYKKTLENYTKSPAFVGAAAVAASKSSSHPKKSLDATNGTAKETDGAAEEETPKDTKSKSRSQSRKRASIFGTLRGKKEEKDEQKELKKEEKEEAKPEHDSSKAKEAAEAAAVAAVPATAVVAEKKHEDKSEEKKSEEKSGATTPTDKKAKRNSVFGSLFGKKNVTSPTTEKTDKEAEPAVSAKDAEALPVAETAPQLEEPIENKPIDTAAVTAPVDTVTTPAAEESTKEMTPAETTTATKSEEKGGFIGFIKKQEAKFAGKKEHKEEKKEEAAGETIAKDSAVAAAPLETPAATETTTEERPAGEKRRTSLFGSLGTLKKKTPTDSEETTTSPIEKREKSPLPGKLTGLFRRPSKAVKPTDETPATTETTDGAKPEAMTNGETAGTSAAVPDSTESKVVGDVVPEDLSSTVHESVTTAPTEVKASA